MDFCSKLHLLFWFQASSAQISIYVPGPKWTSQISFMEIIDFYSPGPKWSFAQITIMVLVLVLSGKWGCAQIFFHGNYGPGPKWSS